MRYQLREDEPGGPACFIIDTQKPYTIGRGRNIVAYCDTLEDGQFVTDALNDYPHPRPTWTR